MKKIKRLFGGKYYESQTDTTYFYKSEIIMWFEIRFFKIKIYYQKIILSFRIFYYKLMMIKKILNK